MAGGMFRAGGKKGGKPHGNPEVTLADVLSITMDAIQKIW